MDEPITVRVDDEIVLEAEIARSPDVPRAGMLLCHPHPQYGGTMRSIVISELFRALPTRGVTCVRFNFRGVERSTGRHDAGRGERADARAALGALASAVAPGMPIVMGGWSFGGDVALSVHDDRIEAWFAIAPPFRFAEPGPIADDSRPKHLVLAEHDEVRPPSEIAALVTEWGATTIEVVPGASHFFVGRTDAVVAAADGLIARVAG